MEGKMNKLFSKVMIVFVMSMVLTTSLVSFADNEYPEPKRIIISTETTIEE
jgi:hypothetical protein